jgi:hypothetical protein
VVITDTLIEDIVSISDELVYEVAIKDELIYNVEIDDELVC